MKSKIKSLDMTKGEYVYLKLMNGDEVVCKVSKRGKKNLNITWTFKFLYAVNPLTGVRYANLVRWFPSKEMISSNLKIRNDHVIAEVGMSVGMMVYYTECVTSCFRENDDEFGEAAHLADPEPEDETVDNDQEPDPDVKDAVDKLKEQLEKSASAKAKKRQLN